MSDINKLFFFKNNIPVKQKAAVLREAADYIDKHADEIDYVRVTAGEPFEGIYVLKDIEIKADLKKNSGMSLGA